MLMQMLMVPQELLQVHRGGQRPSGGQCRFAREPVQQPRIPLPKPVPMPMPMPIQSWEGRPLPAHAVAAGAGVTAQQHSSAAGQPG